MKERVEWSMTTILNRVARQVSLMALFLILASGLSSCRGSTASEGGSSPTGQEPIPTKQIWDQPPEMTIQQDTIYLATLKTERGDIQIELFTDKAPVTANNFIFLAEQGFYDNTTFHRVIPEFMAQAGDPSGTGMGGPGYRFGDEFHPDLRFDQEGLLAMANAGPDSNGSQFFITYGAAPHLTGSHTIFGKVVEGMKVLESLTPRDPQENPDFKGDVLHTVEIEEAETSLLPPPTPTPIPLAPEPEEGRPLAELEIPERENLYNSPPSQVLEEGVEYQAVLSTSQGEVEIQLDPEGAPESVNNFIVLAELGYWDGFPISFVEPGVFVVMGSPQNRPDSDIGYGVTNEVGLEAAKGAVGFLFREDIQAASGSQFFILLEAMPSLEGRFNVFGYVTSGMENVSLMTDGDQILKVVILRE